MKVVAAILSDIHFSTASQHPIMSREEVISRAIGSVENQPDAVVLLFSGDVADKGRTEEYSLAEAFIAALRFHIQERFPSTQIYVASVPGNHDLEHPVDSDDYRKTLVAGSGPSMREPRSNLFYLNRLLEPQDNYWRFAQKFDLNDNASHFQLCNTLTITHDTARMNLHFLNTAILSQKTETQGGLHLPVPILREILSLETSPHLTVTIMHHPVYWIESQTLTELRDLLGETSDYVITGHEHFSSGYDVKSDLAHNLRYYESPALFDPKRPFTSAFRVLVFDIDSTREKHFLFEWDGAIYRSNSRNQTEFEWHDLSLNRIARKSLAINSATLKALNDPGFAAPNREDRDIKLSELFEYPDLSLRKDLTSKVVQLKRGKHVFTFLTEGGVKELHGKPFCGKSTLAKALVLDIRLLGIATPLLIEGKGLSCTTIEDFEKLVKSCFKSQYSPDHVDEFFQLKPERRCIIIDDWHLALISTRVRKEIYEWLGHFTKASIVIVDQSYQIRELIDSVHSAKELAQISQSPTRIEIESLSHVSRAALIHRYLKVRRKDGLEYPEESKEASRLEKVVSQLLGEETRLPAYPFFILCILHALDSNKTDAISGGSLGPLYEVLIFSALAKDKPDDPQLSKKLVFLQEIAFHMWSGEADVISPTEIRDVMSKFTDSNYLSFPTEQFLEELVRAKIISKRDGNYRFCYAQYFQYFVARYIRNHIEDENATIVMFLIYFEKDKNRIIDRLLHNASQIYKSVSPARLENDAVELSSFGSTRIDIPLDENPDVAGNRHRIRQFRDEHEEKRLVNPKTEFEINRFSAYSYTEDLPENCKLYLVTQSINALGQVIRNFSANLSGQRKVQVLKETYLLALRSVARVMDLCKSVIVSFDQLEATESGELSVLEIKKLSRELFVVLSELYAVAICTAVSDNVGIADMDRAYIETVDELDKSAAVKLIDLTVQMNHFSGFPEKLIRDLHVEVKDNPFTATVLEVLVVSQLLVNKVDQETRKRVALSLGLKPRNVTPAKDGPQKLIG
jgi:hypothetical protein